MKAILKYGLDIGMNTLEIPGGLCGVHIQHQPGQPNRLQLWTRVDDSHPVETVKIFVTMTGEPLPEDGHYSFLATAQLNGGAVVLHAMLVQ